VRQQFFEPFDRMVGDAAENIPEPRKRIDLYQFAGSDCTEVAEIEKGSRVQESFMKQASGNDSLVARGLYASEREFRR
jgi:phage/plasmid-associated DNA primase